MENTFNGFPEGEGTKIVTAFCVDRISKSRFPLNSADKKSPIWISPNFNPENPSRNYFVCNHERCKFKDGCPKKGRVTAEVDWTHPLSIFRRVFIYTAHPFTTE